MLQPYKVIEHGVTRLCVSKFAICCVFDVVCQITVSDLFAFFLK